LAVGRWPLVIACSPPPLRLPLSCTRCT